MGAHDGRRVPDAYLIFSSSLSIGGNICKFWGCAGNNLVFLPQLKILFSGACVQICMR